MHPLVRDLYKRAVLVGRDYPGGLELVRRKTKEMMFANRDLKTEEEIKRVVARGRWYLANELVGEWLTVLQLCVAGAWELSGYCCPGMKVKQFIGCVAGTRSLKRIPFYL